VRQVLLSEQAKARKVFSPAHVERVIEEYESGKRSRAYTIFMMLCVELWFKTFIDQRRQETIQPALTKLA
jgi:hypothetical protein